MSEAAKPKRIRIEIVQLDVDRARQSTSLFHNHLLRAALYRLTEGVWYSLNQLTGVITRSVNNVEVETYRLTPSGLAKVRSWQRDPNNMKPCVLWLEVLGQQ